MATADHITHSRPQLTASDQAAVATVLESGMLERGAGVAAVERWFATRYSARAAVATGSGCQALLLALRTLGVGPGDEVIVPSYVCPEVMDPVQFLGARVVLVDSAPDYLPDAARIRAALNRRTRAIVFPYLFGIHRPIDDICALGVPVIEDCAHFLAPGSTQHDIVGELAFFSFKATKLAAGGEGGLVLTRSAARADALRAAASGALNAGASGLFAWSDLNAALVAAQLDRYEAFATARRELAEAYRHAIAPLPGLSVNAAATAMPVPFRLPLVTPNRGATDRLIAALATAGIHARRPVDPPCHRVLEQRGFDVAEQLYAVTLSLPLYPALTASARDRILAAVTQFAGTAA